MYKRLNILVLCILLSSFQTDTFKKSQQRFPRVRQAYQDKEENMQALLNKHHIKPRQLQIYLRAFKTEKQLELWAKNSFDKTFVLLKTYEICRTSGAVGPKRMQGDYQIPEGFYHISRFNPSSNFYLSLGVNYPNKSDRILGEKENLGGDIFIHGACVTIGCIPITNDQIKELYIFCVEAKNSGQSQIPVTIFPAKLSESNYKKLSAKYKDYPDFTSLWADLKIAYDLFNQTRQLPRISFLSDGRHSVSGS